MVKMSHMDMTELNAWQCKLWDMYRRDEVMAPELWSIKRPAGWFSKMRSLVTEHTFPFPRWMVSARILQFPEPSIPTYYEIVPNPDEE